MVFLLSNQNVLHYLSDRGFLGKASERFDDINIEPKSCKNFNLLIHFSDNRHLLVKQEPHDRWGATKGDLLNEWQVYSFVQTCSDVHHLRSRLSDALYFDADHAIVVFNYLTNYRDLDDFYTTYRRFPPAIAAWLGATLAEIHRVTLNRQDLKARLTLSHRDTELQDDAGSRAVPDVRQGLDHLGPEIFGTISADGLKFYRLYQRYDSLSKAIATLYQSSAPCCLIHRDLKFNNVLLHTDWSQRLSAQPYPERLSAEAEEEAIIRLIDWEKWTWGDPALDLGALVASYLKIWLRSLTARAGMDINMTLRLAGTPLEQLQPSLIALMRSYLAHMPDGLNPIPDFVSRVMQFAGLDLVETIQTRLHYQEPFGNIEICMLQVAKALLCAPQQAIATVFGVSESELLDHLEQRQRLDTALEPDTGATFNGPSREDEIDADPIVVSTTTWTRPLTTAAMLNDLVQQVQIHPQGHIVHPHYAPAEQAEGLCDRLLQLPAELQQSYQLMRLRNYLYDIYFSGEQVPIDQAEADRVLENNTVRGVNLAFYEQLQSHNSGKGYFDPGWRVVRKRAGYWMVQKEGLTLHIQPQRHLKRDERSPSIGDSVAIRLPRHRIEPGFYVAVGNAGPIPDDSPGLELCFNVSPEGAIALMRQMTHALNALNLPFSLKVLSDPDEYGRYDSSILHLERHQYGVVRPILQAFYDEERSHLKETVPLFTKPIAPGIGLAEEPDVEPDDFGTNRCQLLAEALLSMQNRREVSPEQRLYGIQQHFAQEGLDLQRPYLNPDAEDIYTALESKS